MSAILFLLLMLFPASGFAAEVFRCGEPKGVTMWSMNGHRADPDKFTGVEPVVIIDGKSMTVVWGDTKAKGSKGTEKVWKAAIFHRSPDTISAAALDDSDAGSAAMLYTIDIKRGYLYLSSHKETVFFDGSGASSFVSKCSK